MATGQKAAGFKGLRILRGIYNRRNASATCTDQLNPGGQLLKNLNHIDMPQSLELVLVHLEELIPRPQDALPPVIYKT